MLKELIDLVSEQGPIPFERFMEISLYGPGGFFAGESLRSDREGDFLTSPEVSSHFGRTLANYVKRLHDEVGDPFTVVEVGAGSGSLLRPIIDELRVPALAIERSPAARAQLSRFADVAVEIPSGFKGVIIANELLDNIPMALAQLVGEQWRERWVGADEDGLVLVDRDPRPQVLEWLARYAGPVADGGWVEVQLAARSWVQSAVSSLHEGALLVIDYGDTAENLTSRRASGTLRTYRKHHLGPDPLDEPGETDITADVNFTALLDLGLPTRLMRQDEFLIEHGLGESRRRLQNSLREKTTEDMESMTIRSELLGIDTILHPRGLGDFRVLEIRVEDGTDE